jgi:hypothetical protein
VQHVCSAAKTPLLGHLDGGAQLAKGYGHKQNKSMNLNNKLALSIRRPYPLHNPNRDTVAFKPARARSEHC